MFGFRSATAAQTASLSAFAQSIGYGTAAVGPLLAGWLYGTAGWLAVFAVLALALALQVGAGPSVARPAGTGRDSRVTAPVRQP